MLSLFTWYFSLAFYRKSTYFGQSCGDNKHHFARFARQRLTLAKHFSCLKCESSVQTLTFSKSLLEHPHPVFRPFFQFKTICFQQRRGPKVKSTKSGKPNVALSAFWERIENVKESFCKIGTNDESYKKWLTNPATNDSASFMTFFWIEKKSMWMKKSPNSKWLFVKKVLITSLISKCG